MFTNKALVLSVGILSTTACARTSTTDLASIPLTSSHNASDSTLDDQSRTLGFAIESYDPPLVRGLLEAGADPNGLVPVGHGMDGEPISALEAAMDASVFAHIQRDLTKQALAYATVEILLEAGADPNRPHGELQRTPFLAGMECARRVNIACDSFIQILLEHGADPNVADAEGLAAVDHLFVQWNDEDRGLPDSTLALLLAWGVPLTPLAEMRLKEEHLSHVITDETDAIATCFFPRLRYEEANIVINEITTRAGVISARGALYLYVEGNSDTEAAVELNVDYNTKKKETRILVGQTKSGVLGSSTCPMGRWSTDDVLSLRARSDLCTLAPDISSVAQAIPTCLKGASEDELTVVRAAFHRALSYATMEDAELDLRETVGQLSAELELDHPKLAALVESRNFLECAF